MIEKFDSLVEKLDDVQRRLSDPAVVSKQETYLELLKQHKYLKEGVDLYHEYNRLLTSEKEATALLKDPEMKELAEAELKDISGKLDDIKQALQIFLIPRDPDDDKSAVVEIRSGTGGDEAALFSYELYRMYMRFSESKGWKIDVIDKNETGLGGLREITFSVQGQQAYRYLKFESGIHRVQRVPDTESSGRVHTSAASVVIFPEVDEHVDIEIDMKDLRIDTFRASGAGGQHVNKTSSAIRITHLPSGVVVACQDERSQFQNKDKAMRVLKSKLYEMQIQKQQNQEASARKVQVGSGDRSEKIRTYNYPQNRLTDHRINLTLYSLSDILEGNLSEVIEALIKADRLARLEK
ncbi:MAG: peptide chain release factor 1 [bacterium]